MSSVTFINPSEDQRWDRFVESHPNGLICHLSGWKEVLEGSFPHIKGHFPVILDAQTNGIRGGVPLYLVSSPFTGRRLVSVPFATLGTPLALTTGEMEELLSAAIQLAEHLSAQRIEIRTLASVPLGHPRYERLDYFKHHFLCLDEPMDRLFKRLHRTSVRQLVSRSEKCGLECCTGCTYEDLRGFFDSYIDLRKRLGLPPQPFRFFENLWRVFAPSGKFRLFQALYRGKPVAGLVVFQFKNRVSAEFITADEKYGHLHPSHFLYWQAIKFSSEQGLEVFDFGRTSPNNVGLMAFKQRWGTKVCELPQYWYPCSINGGALLANAEHSLKYRAIKFLTRKSPRALLPYLGELCYRHLG